MVWMERMDFQRATPTLRRGFSSSLYTMIFGIYFEASVVGCGLWSMVILNGGDLCFVLGVLQFYKCNYIS
ncbi:hypothetical protein G7K_2633-t1 [Saitoella complicata NRRL Y-17804]|uniref:Uncharacterized protein n=1 Tax=Saitoella complicata (strain BCRC 22490 / CBS 7301 / JCM 7358 / NBRC 10748 / NRRL Y-17804) TaxID=698492 RepID=A0A0E9NGD0_SAICN|nr:hypothetical protein G7K_2633-t1 [Saitoella complicata NRRL Y-17804]